MANLWRKSIIFEHNYREMRKFFVIATALFLSLAAFGQTAQEIVARMEAAMPTTEQFEKEGLRMTMDMKIPILGTVSATAYSLGKKTYFVMNADPGSKTGVMTWDDGTSTWTYNPKDKRIEITNSSPTKKDSQSGDVKMFSGITDGYDVSISKETPEAWYIRCKKSKDNTDKDDPKNMDLVVSKANYMALSLSAKVSGITITMRDLNAGVTEDQVTFDASKYPGVTIVDKRLP